MQHHLAPDAGGKPVWGWDSGLLSCGNSFSDGSVSFLNPADSKMDQLRFGPIGRKAIMRFYDFLNSVVQAFNCMRSVDNCPHPWWESEGMDHLLPHLPPA